MKRKFAFLTIMAAVLLLMAGCNLKEKIGQSITEGILDKALGDSADVDLDSGELKIKGEDGQEITFDDDNGFIMEGEDGTYVASGGVYDWPKDSEAAKLIPECKAGKITYLYIVEGGLLLYHEETMLKDYENYLEEIIDAGYTENKWESSAEDMEMYAASGSNGATVTLSFTPSAGLLQITVDTSNVDSE